MKKLCVVLVLAILLYSVAMGCGREKNPAVTETVEESIASTLPTVPETTVAELTQEELIASLPYKPGKMGCYVMASPDIEAGPEVLDSITFEETDGDVTLTRYRVSNRQHDLIKNGMQVGGFLLIDIPREMLDEAADNFDGFKALAQYIGSEVLSEVYPEKAIIDGGGHITGGSNNSFVAISFKMGEGISKAQHLHRIYVGENYCYDFWYDQTWFYDGGLAIIESLSAEDIKPELNHEATFNWTSEEVQAQGKFVF